MTREERYREILKRFIESENPAETELHYQNDYQLLVAVILSAQCTDKRVNTITPALFKAFPTPESMAVSTPAAIYEYIKSCTYPNNKSKNLVGMAKKLLTDFGGEVPTDIDSLLTIPGVGRKTANVMLAVAFNKPAMPVDTHVFRVANRIGLTSKSKTPLETERELVRHIPPELLSKTHHWLILHGRYVCGARKPHCEICRLRPWCRTYEKKIKRVISS
ncbi:MAG: endonuclease III [Proteiniphilum sp.]|jgi:endonuclease-3|nr:endonuclease III [Proteiniphilum sp.]